MFKLFLTLCILAVSLLQVQISAQFINSTVQPLCNKPTITMDCSNFSPSDGSIILGWKVDFDRHDTINAMIARMNAADGPSFSGTLPGAYGLFMKIGASGLIGQTPQDPANPEDLDTVLEQLKGTNAIFVVSLDPVEGYDNVSQADLELFADKIALYNSFGIPVIIRPAHEMNAPWYPYGLQPTRFIEFFINTHNAVKRKAPYAKFAFSPNSAVGYPWPGIPPSTPLTPEVIAILDTNGDGALGYGDDPYTPFYPGDEYVDWMGFSTYWKGIYPYNTNLLAPADFIDSELTTVTGGISSYEFARVRNLPIVFSEMAGTFTAINGGATNLETKRNFWIGVFGPESRAKYPLLKMGLWFDYSKYEDAGQRDFSLSNQNLTTGSSSIDEVAPIFKADIATYSNLIYASDLTLSGSGNCGCFRYNANGLGLNSPALNDSVKNVDSVLLPTNMNLPTSVFTISSTKVANSGTVSNIHFKFEFLTLIVLITFVMMC